MSYRDKFFKVDSPVLAAICHCNDFFYDLPNFVTRQGQTCFFKQVLKLIITDIPTVVNICKMKAQVVSILL